MFSKINQQDFNLYIRFVKKWWQGKTFLTTVSCSDKTLSIEGTHGNSTQGKTASYTNQLKFVFHFVVTDSGNSC